LAVRTSKHIYLDFNPTAEFWAHTELKDDPDAQWLVLTYKDNQAAPKAAVKEILKAKQKADKGNAFWQNWYRVYGLGLVGTLQGAVFTNWKEGKFKEVSKPVYGQDFGFSNDPTTLIKTSIDKDKKLIYLQECFYKKGLTTSQIATLNQKHAGNDLIVADSAEPRLIQELSQYCNIVPTIKGQGSITFGISLLQDYELIVDPDSDELIKELKNYVWLEKRSQTPCDAFNHLLDALRYCVSYQLANPHRGEYFVY
jgi:phage terminase large subunit